MSQSFSRSQLLTFSVAAVLLLLAAGLLFNKWRFDRDSREIAIAINQSVLASGDARLLIEYAHPELLAQMDSVTLQSYVSGISEILGPLQTLDTISGATELAPLALALGTPMASYRLGLVFEATTSSAVVELRRSDGQWLVTAYEVESELLYN